MGISKPWKTPTKQADRALVIQLASKSSGFPPASNFRALPFSAGPNKNDIGLHPAPGVSPVNSCK